MPHHPALFAFEGDFQTDLRCIPMAVRQQLDLCGIKLSLKEWVRLGPEQRGAVVALLDHPEPTGADAVRRFDAAVVAMVEARMGEPPARCPVDPAQAEAEAITLTPAQWSGLAPPQRFALYKLSRSSHKNENFGPACREFGILEA